MSRNISFAPKEYYHIYNRGTEKRTVFENKSDYERFLSLLFFCNDSKKSTHLQRQGSTLTRLSPNKDGDTREKIIDLCAYCLMPNHFHLIVREKIDGGISKFMQRIMTGYTMYFNKKYERNGALFQGRFKAKHITDDRYLKYLISYIHLNPIAIQNPQWKENGINNKSQAKKFLDQYLYSSFTDYCHDRSSSLLDFEALPDYFDSPKNFEDNVTSWLSFKLI